MIACRVQFRNGDDIRHGFRIIAANELQAFAAAMQELPQMGPIDWVTGPGFTIEILSDES